MIQLGATLTDDASSVNYDCNMFVIQATYEENVMLLSQNCYRKKRFETREPEYTLLNEAIKRSLSNLRKIRLIKILIILVRLSKSPYICSMEY